MAPLRLHASPALFPAPLRLSLRWRGRLLGPPSGAPLLLISDEHRRLQRPFASRERALCFQAACVTASGNRRSWPARYWISPACSRALLASRFLASSSP